MMILFSENLMDKIDKIFWIVLFLTATLHDRVTLVNLSFARVGGA
jgi:hypothetical protein